MWLWALTKPSTTGTAKFESWTRISPTGTAEFESWTQTGLTGTAKFETWTQTGPTVTAKFESWTWTPLKRREQMITAECFLGLPPSINHPDVGKGRVQYATLEHIVCSCTTVVHVLRTSCKFTSQYITRCWFSNGSLVVVLFLFVFGSTWKSHLQTLWFLQICSSVVFFLTLMNLTSCHCFQE